MLSSNKRSFTLIEMLIVVVIIGILAGVLIPRIVSARERASDASRDVKVGQISTAIDMYHSDHGSYPLAPFAVTGDGKTAVPSTIAAIATSGYIGPYLSSVPTDTGKGVAVATIDGQCILGGDSFAYYTDLKGSMYAVTSLSESKKGNTTNCKGVVDANNNGGYKVRGSHVGVAGGGSVAIDTSKPGVYHNGGHIIVTDGTNVYTMMDKNLGATQAGTGAASYGWYFQWGNNYGFWNGTGGTVDQNGNATIKQTTTLVSNPAVPYTSDTFVKVSSSPYDWASPQNINLRPPKAQGPCPSGYHVPTKQEWEGLVGARRSIYTTGTNNGNLFRDTLLLPMVGYRIYSTAGIYNQGSSAYYWSSTPFGTYSYNLLFHSSYFNPAFSSGRAYGYSVRCFQD